MSTEHSPEWLLGWLQSTDPEACEELIGLLRPREQQVFRMRAGFNKERSIYTIRDTARRLGCTEQEVKGRMRTIRRKLETEMFVSRLNDAIGQAQEKLDARKVSQS